jgi:hypothetical protein
MQTANNNFKLSKNQLVILSSEEYSDYGYSGPFICRSNFDLSVVAEQVANGYETGNGPDGLMLYLITNGFISRVDCREIHTGSYGNINLCDWSGKNDPMVKLELSIVDDAEYKEAAIQLGL